MKLQEIQQLLSRDPMSLLNWFTTKGTYLNVPIELVYNKVIPLTLGSEIIFDSDNEDIVQALNEWSEQVELYKKCRILIAQASLIGKSMAFLMRAKSGFLDLYIPTYPQMSGVAKVNMREKLAVIWTNLNKSDTPSFAKIIIKENSVAIQEFNAPEDLRVQDISIKENELTPTGGTTVGQLDVPAFPLFEFVNKRLPDFGFMNNTYFSGLPDWFVGRKLLFDIEESLEQKYTERKKNQTRAFGDMDTATVEQVKKDISGFDLEEIFGDFMVRSTLSGYNQGGSNGITVIQGDPKLDVYHADIKETLEQFYRTAGYNFRPNENDTYENKTKSIMTNDLDTQTTELKQKELREGLYRLIDIVLADQGLDPRENGMRNYTIKFATGSIVDKVQKMDLIERRIALGLMSRVEGIQILDNVSKQVAQNKLEEIDEDQMNKMAMEQAFSNNEDDTDNSVDDGGKLKNEVA